MIGTITIVGNDKKMLTINFSEADLIGKVFGRNNDKWNVDDIINQVKELYKNEIKDYKFSNPTNEQIRIDYIDEPIDRINISWSDNLGYRQYPCVALNQPHRHNIFMSYPVKNNCINAKQLLSHEVGHWFLNQVIEYKIKADENHVSRSIISGYEDNLSERAAIYCESENAGIRSTDCQYSQYIDTIIEIKKTKLKKENYLSNILNECLEQWEKDRK